MALLANGARGMPPRVHRAYRLEMSGRTLLTLLSLLTLTGLVVFYLGVVTGKGLRDPNTPVVASATAPGAAGAPAAGTDPTSLTFNKALSSPTPQIEGLKSDQTKLSENTDKLVAQARQQLELEEVPAKSALTASPAKLAAAKTAPAPAALAPKSAPSVAAAAPAKPAAVAMKPAPVAAKPPVAAPAAMGNGAYTVQVFSSTKQANASELMASLKKKGFPAYLNQYQDENKQTWYRVRVGKGSKAEADAMAAKLKASGDIKSPKVMQQ